MFGTALPRLRLRLRRGIETRGLLGLTREAARRLFAVDEEYAWYVLDLRRVEPIALAEGYDLRLATEGDVELLHELPAVPVEEGRQRVREGVQLWFVLRGREPAFVCFVFRRGMFPLEAAPRGKYALPDGVACLENGLASRKYRGRLLAPAAWTAIGERLRREGSEVLMTRTEVENRASRRTLEKTGFRAAGVMHRRRRGLRSRVAFRDEGMDLTPLERAAADDLKRTVLI